MAAELRRRRAPPRCVTLRHHEWGAPGPGHQPAACDRRLHARRLHAPDRFGSVGTHETWERPCRSARESCPAAARRDLRRLSRSLQRGAVRPARVLKIRWRTRRVWMQDPLQLLDANRSSCYTFPVELWPGINFPMFFEVASGPIGSRRSWLRGLADSGFWRVR